MANGNKNTQSVPKTDIDTSKGNKTLKFVPLTYLFYSTGIMYWIPSEMRWVCGLVAPSAFAFSVSSKPL